MDIRAAIREARRISKHKCSVQKITKIEIYTENDERSFEYWIFVWDDFSVLRSFNSQNSFDDCLHEMWKEYGDANRNSK